MRTVATIVVVALLALLGAGCSGSKIDSKIEELAAKPPATDIKGAKALYDEVNNLIRWHDQPGNPKMTDEQKKKAEALRERRLGELKQLGGDKIFSVITGALDSLGVDVSGGVGGFKDWFLGTNDPRLEEFASPKHKKGAEKEPPEQD